MHDCRVQIATSFLVLYLLLAVATTTLSKAASAQVIETKLLAGDGMEGDRFGRSLSLSGSRVIVGAYQDDDLGTDSGSVYVFERHASGAWSEVAKLIPLDGAEGDRFGVSVSQSGDFAVIGAYFDDEADVGSGSAFVFERQANGSWLQVAKLTAFDGARFDIFGFSVSVSDDRALVGATWDDNELGQDAGSAYLFERQDDGAWQFVDKLTASDGSAYDRFGISLSLVGEQALIGADQHDEQGYRSGAVYVFERQEDGSWLEKAKFSASDGSEYEYFGYSVSLSADCRAIIGAIAHSTSRSGSAYVFERDSSGAWVETAKLLPSDGGADDWFGYSTSIYGDRAIVGAYRHDGMGEDSGATYVYERNQRGVWQEVAKLAPLDNSSGDSFGGAVSLGDDLAAISADWDDDNGIESGAIYVFEDLHSLPTAADESATLFGGHLLSAPKPNPFSRETRFDLALDETQHARVEVYSTLGRLVAVLYDGVLLGGGVYGFSFYSDSLSSGVYLLRVTAETFTATRTMTSVK